MDTRKYALDMFKESRDNIIKNSHYDIQEIQAVCKEYPELMFETFEFKDMAGNITIKGDLVAYAVYMRHECLFEMLNKLTEYNQKMRALFVDSATLQILRTIYPFFPLNPFFAACKQLEEAKNNKQPLDEHIETVIAIFKTIPNCILSLDKNLKPLSWKGNINLFMLEVSKTYNTLENAIKFPEEQILHSLNLARRKAGEKEISLDQEAINVADLSNEVVVGPRSFN